MTYDDNDAAIDAWNNGAIDGIRGNAQASDDRDYLHGYIHGAEQRKVRPVMPVRPEGYYHSAPEVLG
jgi:hypothetical protein